MPCPMRHAVCECPASPAVVRKNRRLPFDTAQDERLNTWITNDVEGLAAVHDAVADGDNVGFQFCVLAEHGGDRFHRAFVVGRTQ